MQPAAICAAALLDRACHAWDQNDLTEVRELATLATGGGQRDEERFLWEALLGCVEASLGHAVAATFVPEDLDGIDPITRARISYFAALAAYLRREYTRATWWLLRSPSPTPPLHARRLLLEADLAAAHDETAHCSSLLLAALDLLVRGVPAESRLVRRAADGLSMLSSDVALNADAIQSLISLPSQPTCATLSPAIRRIAGWTHVLQGQAQAALNAFVQEELLATAPLDRLSACLDRAELAIFTDLREHGACSPTIALIEGYLSLVPCDDDSIPTLVQAAGVLAELGSLESSLACCNIVRHAIQGLSARSMLAHGTLLEALVAEAYALAYRHREGHEVAEWAGKAYALLKRLGFDWRAARIATVLYEVHHVRRWQERALAHLAHYPDSAFPRLLLFGALTPREREILVLMCDGHNVSAISDRLDLGESTVRTHVRSIYRKFGARNYAQLLSKAV
jgi:DNA-binding CsgD family transcriptional regulator